MTKMVAGHGESNQAELHGFPAKKNTKPGLAVWRYQVLWQSFQQNLELRWGWGKFTTRKVYWRRKQLPSKNRGTNTYFQDELDVICQREFDVGGPGRIHWVAWNSQNVPQNSAEGFPARSSKGRKLIQTTEFLKQTVNASDTRILNDLMYLIGTPHMFVCVGVDLMCHRYYIRYSNKFWHVSPKILGRMFGYFWMTGSFLMFFIYMSIISISQSATSGFELWSSRQIPRCLRVLLQVVWKRTSWAEMMWMRYSKIIFVYTLLIDIFDWTL